MSKSKGTGVFLNTSPSEMFGAIMAQPDEMIEVLLINCTRISKEEIKEIVKLGPLEAKKKTAAEIIKVIFNEKEAKKSEQSFINTFQKKEIPEDINEFEGEGRAIDVLVSSKTIESMSAARRLFEAGAVTDMTDEKKLTQNDTFEKGHVYKIGKHRFIKIK